MVIARSSDGKRQRLQRTLETLNPVEFVLPAGKLSAYTEQLLENFTATSAARTSVSFMENAVIPCIRVERIPNECFECSLARETFSRVFCDAEAEYSGVVAHPSLPKLCMSCFGGMWNYLSSLGVAKSLIAPSYSATATIVGQFHLPPETHQDLDLFVNSVSFVVFALVLL
ncbi:unnamed protein product [Phytophthora lilii]|uniref:Unnamed protein product n=1 Tax=Phytophthora lilii TaxID=2077276 RepID=A0A9W6WP23_9STRA|nr:unnamed protein product [Phytophthora lilii]